MKHLTVTERIYVDAKGRPVSASYTGAKRLAYVPGNVLSREQALKIGMKEKDFDAALELQAGLGKARPPAEDKSRQAGEDKARKPGEQKG